ncbi:MAG TPA: hypothetical protein PKA35_13750, partial [Paracoccus solventivorans]|nr:hypothetical protein [Paracoccus solventivorans]
MDGDGIDEGGLGGGEGGLERWGRFTATFEAELARLGQAMGQTGREVSSLTAGFGGGLRRGVDGLGLGGGKLSGGVKSVARSPHLDYFRAHDIEVLYLVDPIDGYVTSILHEAAGKPLQNVDDAGLSLPQDD